MSPNKMKIAVIGAGAIGGVVAALLKKSGEDVTIVARPEQIEVINTKGLLIKGINGEDRVAINAIPKLDQFYDLVIFTVKTQDLEDAYTFNNEYLEEGLVLTTQNGVQADNILSIHFDVERILSSIVMFGATYQAPGEIIYNFKGDWILGKPFTALDPQLHEIAKVLEKAFPVVISENIMGMKYLKLFVNFNNCIPALIGKSMQETFADMDFCRLSIELLREGVDIVNKAKIDLVSLPSFPVDRVQGLVAMPVEQAAGIINKTLTGLSKEPLYGSILQSIMRGKVSEIDFINGEVVALASQIQMKAPLNKRIVQMVHTVEETKKYFNPDEVKKAFNLKTETRV